MPCCSNHNSQKVPVTILSSRPTSSDEVVGDALLNLSVLKTLSEHVDGATAVACYSVCRAWREAFGLSCLNSTLCASEAVDTVRSRFSSNLHGAVTLEVTHPARQAQRGFDRHIAALCRNRHFVQLKVHLPVREASEPQLALSALSSMQPLTQLTALVISRNPAFTSAPHVVTEDDLAALSHLRALNFLELCTAVPPPLGLSQLASLACTALTQLRTLAFGHTSALWRIPQVAALCQILDVCPLLTDLRLRCCTPPRDAKQLPELMQLPLPQRLTNFALTFARRLAPGEHGAGGGLGAAPAAAAAVAAAAAAFAGGAGGAGDDNDEEGRFGEYEEMDEPWDSVDHLAPKPGLHVLIVEKGVRVTRMDVNVTISVAASELPTVSLSGPREEAGSRQQRGRDRSAARGVAAASTSGAGPSLSSFSSAAAAGVAATSPRHSVDLNNEASAQDAGAKGPSNSGGADGKDAEAATSGVATGLGTVAAAAGVADGDDDEEDVPPYDVTPMVIAEYERLLHQELGLTGALAQPEDLHLGVRLDILEDEEDGFAEGAAAAFHNLHLPGIPVGAGGGPLAQQILQLQAAMQAALQAGPVQPAPAPAAAAGAGAGGGLPAPVPVGHGAGPGAQGLFHGLQQAGWMGGGGGQGLAMLLNHFAQLGLAGGGGGGAAGANHNAPGGNIAQQQNPQQQQGGGAGGGGRGGGAGSAPLEARAVQLQLGQLSPHMCYLNMAVVPMVTQLEMVGPGLGPNGEDVLQPPQPPADTPVAPVLLDVRGGGYTQLKSLAITGYVDQECRPATWMSRGWLSRIPTGMPSLEYLALYDTLPAAANDPKAIEDLRSLSRLEHLELRPLYLRFTGEVACPLTVPPLVLPTKLVQLTLKKVTMPLPPPLPAGVTRGSEAALALLPDLPVLTHLWLFDCTAPDLTVFQRATRLEDLRLGGTTTTTRLQDLLAPWPCLRGVILDCSHTAAPGWWSAQQMSALSSLRCLRSLQLDAASLDPPPPSSATGAAASGCSKLRQGSGLPASGPSTAPHGPTLAAAAAAAPSSAPVFDSDDDSDAYLSTEEDGYSPPAGGDNVAPAVPRDASPVGAADRAGGNDSDVASVLNVLAGMTQLTDLTLSFDTPTLFFDPEEDRAAAEDAATTGATVGGSGGGGAAGATADHGDGNTDSADSDDDSSLGVGAGPSGGGTGAKRYGNAANGGRRDSDSDDPREVDRRHSNRVYDALLAGQSFVALGALQGLWRLRIGLPHGSVWEDVTDRLLPALRRALPRTAVEMDVL